MATHETIRKNNQAVVITTVGVAYMSCVFVNTRNGMEHAHATAVNATHSTYKGAKKWADKQLAKA